MRRVSRLGRGLVRALEDALRYAGHQVLVEPEGGREEALADLGRLGLEERQQLGRGRLLQALGAPRRGGGGGDFLLQQLGQHVERVHDVLVVLGIGRQGGQHAHGLLQRGAAVQGLLQREQSRGGREPRGGQAERQLPGLGDGPARHRVGRPRHLPEDDVLQVVAVAAEQDVDGLSQHLALGQRRARAHLLHLLVGVRPEGPGELDEAPRVEATPVGARIQHGPEGVLRPLRVVVEEAAGDVGVARLDDLVVRVVLQPDALQHAERAEDVRKVRRDLQDVAVPRLDVLHLHPNVGHVHPGGHLLHAPAPRELPENVRQRRGHPRVFHCSELRLGNETQRDEVPRDLVKVFRHQVGDVVDDGVLLLLGDGGGEPPVQDHQAAVRGAHEVARVRVAVQRPGVQQHDQEGGEGHAAEL
mmetsp:Transcript_4371/g.12236  ORF Transcript_4371/g.12236 Transcript_4371/m.12236 type:complete len:415 (+) Transcript_4371:3-1247(+)